MGVYIGETNHLRFRVNNHRNDIEKDTGLCVSRHIANCARNKTIKFKITPFYKVKEDSIEVGKNKEQHFTDKFNPELNR